MKNTMKAGILGLSAVALPFAGAAEDAPQERVQVAQLESSPQQVSFSDAAHGKPVQFIYGSGVNDFTLQSVVESVEEAGCPVTTRQLSDTDMIIARTNGEGISTDDIVFAGQWTLDNCLD